MSSGFGAGYSLSSKETTTKNVPQISKNHHVPTNDGTKPNISPTPPKQSPKRTNLPSSRQSFPPSSSFDPALMAGIHNHLPSTSVYNFHSNIFTPREEELQKLLAEERQRSEQRRNNYQTLKEEHLKLQNEFLGLQSEMKQILEETVYFKEKKNNEVEQLLKCLEDKGRLLEKMEHKLRDNDPEILRLKFAEEIEEPLRKVQKEKDKLEREKENAIHELKLNRQQLEHLEKEHLDSMERIKLSYEAEINLIKREKEEIRTRLVEASQSPDVKRLIELSEENSRLNRKFQSAQLAIEQAEQQYKQIQTKVEDFIAEQEQKERIFENEIRNLREQIESQKQELKQSKAELISRKQDNEELQNEIEQSKRYQDKLKADASQQLIRSNEDKEEMKRKMNLEIKNLQQEKVALNQEIKKLKNEIEAKNETIESMEQLIANKSKEINQKLSHIRDEELEQICKLKQEKKTLDNTVKELLDEKQGTKLEMETLRKQIEQQTEQRLAMERETMLLRTKVDTQSCAIEELEKIRRQHVALHDEVNRLRSETYDLAAANKELTRIGQNAREEYGRLKEQLEEERHNLEEVKISNEKVISKISRRFEEERTELREKIDQLERENSRLKSGIGSKCQDPGNIGKLGPTEIYSRLKAKQYSKMADRLNLVLDQLKIDDTPHEQVNHKQSSQLIRDGQQSPHYHTSSQKDHLPSGSAAQSDVSDSSIPLEAHNHLRKELQKIKKKQLELEAYFNLGQKCSVLGETNGAVDHRLSPSTSKSN